MSFPEARLIKTNGIELAVHEAGPKDGVPIVLCHGFPELAYSWRHQIPALEMELSVHLDAIEKVVSGIEE